MLKMEKLYKVNELENLELKDITFSEPKYINHKHFIENTSEFYIQTGNMKCVQNFYKHNNKMYINLEISSQDLIDLLINIDNTVLELLVNNFKEWFGEDKDSSMILEYFIPTVIQKRDKNSLVIEIPLNDDNNIDVNIYNNNNELINSDNLISINNCMSIIRLNGVYLEKNRLYCNWELVQMKVVD